MNISVVLFLLSAIYISKLAYCLFKDSELEKKTNWVESLPIILLCILNIALYIIFRNNVAHTIPIILVLIFTAVGVLLSSIKINVPKLIEYFYNNCVTFVYDKVAFCANFIEQKILSNYKPVILILKAGVSGFNFIEENIMNKTIKKFTDFCKFVSVRDSIIQTKNVQSYNAYAFILITIIVTLIMILIGKLS